MSARQNIFFISFYFVSSFMSAIILCIPSHAFAYYSLPDDPNSCPAGCRRIHWVAGSDLWNNGILPVYPSVNCTGLAGDGVTDDGPAIQACINSAADNTAVYLPAGTYYVNGTVRLRSSVALRGAGPDKTFINLGANGWLTTQNFSTSVHLDPATSYGAHSPGYLLAGAPKKGDTVLAVASGTVNAGDWISVFSDDDSTLVTANGADGHCTWCADNTGYHLMQQIVRVNAKNGSSIFMSRPLYYTLFTNPQYRKYTFPTKNAGFEDFKVSGVADRGAGQLVTLQGALFCWVKNVETFNTGSSSGSAHIELDFSYGCEVRECSLHDGRSSASGANYGVYFQFVNSDHKVENNVMRHNRHSIVYQGGGSGTAVLYNYMDDNFTDDLTYLGSARTSHGAHPYMNLFEGNIISHIAADNFWGTSSHFVFFRNWLWGDETGAGVPGFPPADGYVAVDVYPLNTYYSFVGNVLGVTGMHTAWPAATLRGFNSYASPTAPMVYSYGGASGTIPSTDATSLNHGNFDYKTNGVAFWEGGADHALTNSMYYASKPSWWCDNIPWPPIGPDVTGQANDIPAKLRYDGTSCAAAVIQGTARGPLFDKKVIGRLYDVSGRCMLAYSGSLDGMNRSFALHEGGLRAGVYIWRISGDGTWQTVKRVVIK
ncbi:MAG TPA: glycosyl hydrolase family 28-related protein [Chitinivibrionales bacterium]|nr:glycosyl hydrolase family 28-related protein [Chitinivibrionales bacterium]